MSNNDSFTVEIFEENEKKCPFDNWLGKLDKATAARIEARISRFRNGNFGDHKKIEGAAGIWEARFFFGSGYRLYFSKEKSRVVLLLVGGDKSTQNKDIRLAEKFLKLWRTENV